MPSERPFDPELLYEPDEVAALRDTVAALPFPPVAEQIAEEAARPSQPALQALLRAARDVLGDPGAASVSIISSVANIEIYGLREERFGRELSRRQEPTPHHPSGHRIKK